MSKLKRQWDEMVRRSFHPTQWFTESRPDDLNESYPEDRVMYVYRSTGAMWSVGYFTPTGEWEQESAHFERESAAERVHWLNGGSP